jgi:DUF438 domain-containing protein
MHENISREYDMQMNSSDGFSSLHRWFFRLIISAIFRTDIEKVHQHNIDTLGDKPCNLQNEIHQLEEFVARFKNTNKKYLRTKSIVEEIVNGLLTENGAVQALRMNPDRYCNIIFSY